MKMRVKREQARKEEKKKLMKRESMK